MENIIKNPGLQHIAENVFLNLNYEKLETCRLVNESCKKILDNPMFWIKKFVRRGFSKKNQIDWTVAIQITKPYLETNILKYLKQGSKNERVVDIPCHINKELLRHYSQDLMELMDSDDDQIVEKLFDEIQSGDDDAKQFQILALFMDNHDYELFHDHEDDSCPILEEVTNSKFENLQIVKILAPLTDNPNAPDEEGTTPIYWAACHGHTEIVKILAALTDNPNASAEDGDTPIHAAARYGHTEIVKILVKFTGIMLML